MTPYEITEHTADLGILATGETFEELLASAGEGLFTVIAPGFSFHGSGGSEIRFSVQADSAETLLHEWLDPLTVQAHLAGTELTKFEIQLQGYNLSATARAQAFDPAVHETGVEVKAVTWHDLYVRQTKQGYEGYVLLDI